MAPGEQSDQTPTFPQPASPTRLVIRNDCRAARIGEVTEFAECLVKTVAACPHRFTFDSFLYCVHPEREAIIARTLAQQGTPGK
ncbi:MAG: hypothetical protein ACLQU3_02075 [Limisphaerales bacterium]